MTMAPHHSPTEECDLVMKGGITSGVVYPPAVLKLRNKYRFRSIGGSSAGAIAAALTAAAEYRREDGGFDRFEDTQEQVRSGEFLFIVLFGTFGGLLYGIYDLYHILSKEVVQNNFYGVCTGRGEDLDSLDETVLTDWLYAKLNLLANKVVDEPLTFDDLASKKARVDAGEQESVGISLRMMTTNLNHGQHYVFPNKESTFIFKEHEMLRYFPKEVVAYMREHRAHEDVRLPAECYFLPQGNELPVIVAVRMSLAFPVLLSAIPLYTIKPESWAQYDKNGPQELHEGDLQRNLFSDGGICSNFPIHFFDAWLPKRPTFGINLMPSKPKGQERVAFSVYNVGKGGSDPVRGDDVWLPPPEGWENAEYTDFQGLGGFARDIFSSAQNYRDNT